jgi:nucleoside-diphosphate-sugar epimerase
MDYLESYRGKSILVTGGVGAIGSNLVKALSSLDVKKIIVLDDLSSSSKWNLPSLDKVLFVQGSVTEDIALKRVFNEEPNIVFHLAAFFANQNSVDFPEKDLNINGLGTLKMLEYSQLTKVDRLVYASSGCSIYGGDAPLPLKEEFMSMRLSTPYQITKMLGELYCNFYNDHFDLDIVKARFFNSYGPGEIPGQYRNVIPNFIYWALSGKPLPITGNPNATRDFTFVEDLVDGLLRLGTKKEARGLEFNLAGSREIEIGNLAKMINELTGNKSGINIVGSRKWDTKSRVLASIDRASKTIGYQPKTDFEDGLLQTVTWFKENWNQINQAADFPPGVSSAVREAVSAKQ